MDQANLSDPTLTHLAFVLDGHPTSNGYFHGLYNDRDFLYNQLVYKNKELASAASLPGGQRNLTIIEYGNILFDYALYTYVALSCAPLHTRYSNIVTLAGLLVPTFLLRAPSLPLRPHLRPRLLHRIL